MKWLVILIVAATLLLAFYTGLAGLGPMLDCGHLNCDAHPRAKP
jgi:hypothetical protein